MATTRIPPKISGGSHAFFGQKYAGKKPGPIDMDLKPIDPKVMRNLQAPITQPAKWGHYEKILFNQLLWAVGHELEATLKNVIRGRESSIHLQQASRATRALRKGNRASNPLFDMGKLYDSIYLEVEKEGTSRPQLRLSFRGMQPSGSGGVARPMNLIVAALESGYTIRITAKMRRYFAAKAKELGKDSTAGAVYRGLASKRVDSEILVPPRPFVAPSMELAVKRFKRKYVEVGGKGGVVADTIMRAWVFARISPELRTFSKYAS